MLELLYNYRQFYLTYTSVDSGLPFNKKKRNTNWNADSIPKEWYNYSKIDRLQVNPEWGGIKFNNMSGTFSQAYIQMISPF